MSDRPKRALVPGWVKQLTHNRWVPAALAVVAAIWGVVTYVLLSRGLVTMDSSGAIALIFGNLAIVTILAVLITRRVVRLWVGMGVSVGVGVGKCGWVGKCGCGCEGGGGWA